MLLAPSRASGAPELIVVALSMSWMDRYHDAPRQQVEHTMAVQATAAAIQNMLLAVHAQRLAAAWMRAPLFCAAVVNDAASLPDDREP